MRRLGKVIFDPEHPLRNALVSLAFALANAAEAVFLDRPQGGMQALIWGLTAVGLLGFVVFLIKAVFGYFAKTD